MSEFETFKKYLSEFLEVPPLEWVALAKLLRVRILKKNDLYFHQGDVVDEIGFIVKGLCCNFYVDAKGLERVSTFVDEGHPVAAYSSLLLGVPAHYSCRALETTTLMTLKYKDLQGLYDRHKCWERMGRISAERIFVEKELREKDFLLLDATGKYQAFLASYPKMAERVPQFLIASYLGISEVSLSRLKRNL